MKALFGYLLAALTLVGAAQAQPAAAQTNGEPDQQEKALHYSLYWENFKNNNYQDALPDLLWILEKAPTFPKNDDRNFERAVQAYDSLAAQTEDPAQQQAYLDSALVLFERVVPVLTEAGGEVDEFQWMRDKGRFIQSHEALRDQRGAEAIQSYVAMYQLDPKRTDPYYLDVIFKAYYSEGDLGKALDFLGEILEERGDEPAIVEVVNRYQDLIPAPERLDFFLGQLEDHPDDIDLIGKVVRLAQDEGNMEIVREYAPRLLDMEATPQTVRLLMQIYLEDGDYTKATELFNQLESMPDADIKAEDYLNMGIAQQNQSRYGAAKSYYQKALQKDADFSRARKAVADLYATAVADCGVADREASGVFWLVSDAYRNAGDNAAANRYAQYFPDAEAIFYTQKWTEGQQTSVSYSCKGLSISGTTTVRKKQ